MRALSAWHSFDHGWAQAGAPAPGVRALLGPELEAPAPFDQVIPSWSAVTPADSWVEVQLRAGSAERWTRFYRIARWDDHLDGSVRSSFDAEDDDDARVATDTLVLRRPAERVQARVLLKGAARLRAFFLALSARAPLLPLGASRFAPIELPVPARSQMIYPDGGNVWCSPTSVAMVLAYWHARTGDERLARFLPIEAIPALVVPAVYDPVYDGHGNWAFNTAFAASYGLEAYVARFERLADLARWVAAEVPVIMSIAWEEGELDGAAIRRSSGHLLVVTGFDGQGNLIVADPAAPDAAGVRRLYRADQLYALWQRNSQGAVYLIYPPGWPTPRHSA